MSLQFYNLPVNIKRRRPPRRAHGFARTTNSQHPQTISQPISPDKPFCPFTDTRRRKIDPQDGYARPIFVYYKFSQVMAIKICV